MRPCHGQATPRSRAHARRCTCSRHSWSGNGRSRTTDEGPPAVITAAAAPAHEGVAATPSGAGPERLRADVTGRAQTPLVRARTPSSTHLQQQPLEWQRQVARQAADRPHVVARWPAHAPSRPRRRDLAAGQPRSRLCPGRSISPLPLDSLSSSQSSSIASNSSWKSSPPPPARLRGGSQSADGVGAADGVQRRGGRGAAGRILGWLPLRQRSAP